VDTTTSAPTPSPAAGSRRASPNSPLPSEQPSTASSLLARPQCNSPVKAPASAGKRGCRACVDLAKAMEGAWEPGAGAEEPSGVGDVERAEGCRGNWRGPPRPWSCGDQEPVCL
jgi:hypothetical protein